MMKLFIALMITVSAFASTREEAKTWLSKMQSYKSTTKRLDMFSKQFIGLPYGEGGPLGEGETGRYDQDPLYRFDTFDCVTYVETIVSLALARDVNEFEDLMDKIRYDEGKIDYLTRNHWTSLQWVPNNLKNGLLREINHLVLPKSEQKLAEANMNIRGWISKIKIEEIRVPYATATERSSLLEELHALSENFGFQMARINYLPINTLVARPALLEKIPHGTIVNFVRPNWDLTQSVGTHINVSHQGFIFRKADGLYLRHASTTGLVMENKLIDYLKKYENHATLKGIHLMSVN